MAPGTIRDKDNCVEILVSLQTWVLLLKPKSGSCVVALSSRIGGFDRDLDPSNTKMYDRRR
jgi:hypothetical protein